jgi:phage minor structural protein
LDYKTEKILATLDNKESAPLFWDDNHKESLKDNLETFDFTMQATVPAAEFVSQRNLIVISDEDGFYREFIILETYQYDRRKEVRSEASFVEIAKQKILNPARLSGQTIITAGEYVLQGTEWQLGITEFSGSRTIEWKEHVNALKALHDLASVFELELRFRVEISANRIIGRYVDFVNRVGRDNKKEIVLGKDLIGVRRRENSDIVTALVGLGPEREDGSRIIVRVEDKDALQRWGKNGKHLWGIYTPETDDLNMTEERLTTLTRTELNKRINTAVQYEADVESIEHIFGFEHEKVRLGDTARIKDTSYSPPLYLEARVIDVERAVSNRSRKKFILGDFIEYSEDEIMAVYKQLKARLDLKVSMYKSPTPPPQPYHDQLWIDTSNPDMDVWKRWDADLGMWKEGPGGPEGPPGEDGQTFYTWIKYADDEFGNGMSDSPEGKKYLGIANNQTSPTESTNPADYTWSLMYQENAVIQDNLYNGISIGNQNGFEVIRSDGLVRVVMNATGGIQIQRRASTTDAWTDVFFVDTNGNLKLVGNIETQPKAASMGGTTVRDSGVVVVHPTYSNPTMYMENGFFRVVGGLFESYLGEKGLGLMEEDGSFILQFPSVVVDSSKGLNIKNQGKDITLETLDWYLEQTALLRLYNSGAIDIDSKSQPTRMYGNLYQYGNLYAYGQVQFLGSEPVTNQTEEGSCGTSGYNFSGTTTGVFAGSMINFRTKKTYIPSSISLTVFPNTGTNHGKSPSVTAITDDGFWLYLIGDGVQNWRYWRGTYRA